MHIPDSFHAALRAGALVTQMAIITAVCALGGWFLDGWLETSPVFVLALGGLGFAVGLYAVWRAMLVASQESSESQDNPPESQEPRDPS